MHNGNQESFKPKAKKMIRKQRTQKLAERILKVWRESSLETEELIVALEMVRIRIEEIEDGLALLIKHGRIERFTKRGKEWFKLPEKGRISHNA